MMIRMMKKAASVEITIRCLQTMANQRKLARNIPYSIPDIAWNNAPVRSFLSISVVCVKMSD